jgi:Ni/Fe-hydrogenase subunit HybB-like protein
VVLGVFGVLRLDLLNHNGVLGTVFQPTYESHMFLIEFALGVVLPVGLLVWPRIRRSPTGLVVASVSAVLGFIMHRLNVSVTGLERASGTHYTPSWMELTVSIGLVAMAFVAFALAVRYLPVFPEHRAAPGAMGDGEEPAAADAASG